jgi:alkanesulfonate monooxygenase SsuD/methylene tetrahydromethanopterin reductase-like flavin-dependent oxidoreductase (luciferase family)
MRAGMLLPQIGDSTTRENVMYIAKDAEREGLDSVWVFDRLLWPLKPQNSFSYAGTAASSLPVECQNVLDPLETLTYLAGNTEQISLHLLDHGLTQKET